MAQLTQKAITESFIALLNERPLDKITVKDIAEHCGVTRNTFYYHFSDIPTLLVNILNEEAKRVMLENKDFMTWEDSFINAAKFSLENRRLIYHIYKSVQREDVENYLNTIAREVMRQYVDRASAEMKVSEEDKSLIVDFYKSALVGLILDWVNQGMRNDPVEFIKRCGFLFRDNIEVVLARAAAQE